MVEAIPVGPLIVGLEVSFQKLKRVHSLPKTYVIMTWNRIVKWSQEASFGEKHFNSRLSNGGPLHETVDKAVDPCREHRWAGADVAQ